MRSDQGLRKDTPINHLAITPCMVTVLLADNAARSIASRYGDVAFNVTAGPIFAVPCDRRPLCSICAHAKNKKELHIFRHSSASRNPSSISRAQ